MTRLLINSSRAIRVLAAATSFGFATAPSFAQGEPPAPKQVDREAPRAGRNERGLGDGHLLKERLQQRMDDMDSVRERLRDAIARLDKGDAPADIMRDMAPLLRGINRGKEAMGRPNDEADDMPPPGGLQRPDGPGPRRGGKDGRDGRDGRDGDDGDRRPGQAGRAGQPSPEDREEMLAIVRKEAPDIAAMMDRMQANEPGIANRFGGKLFPRVREAMALRDHDPEMFKLKIREIANAASIFEAVRSCRTAARDKSAEHDAKVAAAEQTLRSALSEQFEVRKLVLSKEIEDLSKRVSEMKSDLERTESNRSKSIDELMQKVREGKDLRELSPPNHRPPGSPMGGPPSERGGERGGDHPGGKPDGPPR